MIEDEWTRLLEHLDLGLSSSQIQSLSFHVRSLIARTKRGLKSDRESRADPKDAGMAIEELAQRFESVEEGFGELDQLSRFIVQTSSGREFDMGPLEVERIVVLMPRLLRRVKGEHFSATRRGLDRHFRRDEALRALAVLYENETGFEPTCWMDEVTGDVSSFVQVGNAFLGASGFKSLSHKSIRAVLREEHS